MARRKLLVRRKGFTRSDGTRVKPTTFLIKDRGRPGRGPDTIEIKREGAMTNFARRRGFIGGDMGVTDMSNARMREFALALARNQGPAKALRMFQAQISFRARARGERLANRRKFEVGKEAIQKRFFPEDK